MRTFAHLDLRPPARQRASPSVGTGLESRGRRNVRPPGRTPLPTDDIALDGEPTAVGEASASGTPTAAHDDPASHPLALAQGDRVGRYVILGRLGSGAMGAVYSAFDPRLDRRVALKLMHGAGDTPEGPGVIDEAQAMARLSHRNVVAVHDVGEHEGHVFLAMELLEGCTLARWLGEGRRGWREILAVFRQAGEGLAAAHHKRIVHRDFKPQNVMVGDDGRVAVTDFGLARPSRSVDGQMKAGRTEVDAPGRIRFQGTPAYSAPEQHRDEDVGAAADQFSFCVALYRALYRQHPFAGESPVELAYHITRGEVRSPPAGRDVPTWLRQAIVRGLARRPEDRHESMRALLAALGRDPSRRRRWLFGGVALLAVAPATLAVEHIAATRTEAACDEEAASLDEVWNESRREEIRDAMRETGMAAAETTFDRASAVLDDYAGRWKSERGSVCRLAASSPSEPLHQASRACLDQRRLELDTFLAVLGEVAPRAMRSALVNASSLTDPQRCTERRWLARNPPLPRSFDDDIVALQRAVVRASALTNVGEYERAVELAASATRRGKERALPALAAEATAVWANSLNKVGRYSEAEELGEAAFYEALEAGADLAAVDLAVALAYGIGYGQRRHDEGEKWARLGMAIHAREAMPASKLARLYHVRATVRQIRGDLDAATADNEAALAIRREVYGEVHPLLVDSLINLSNVLIQIGDTARARHRLAEANAIAAESYGPHHPHLSSLAELEGNVESLAGRPEAALENHRRALTHRLAVFGEHHPAVTTSRWNVAVTLETLGDVEAADAEHREILRAYDAMGHGSTVPAVRSLVQRGRIALARQDIASTRAQYLQARARLEDVRETGRAMVDARIDLAQLAAWAAGPDDAIELLEDALAGLHDRRAARTVDAARVLGEMAMQELNRGHAERARALMDEAEEIFEAKLRPADRERVVSRVNGALIDLSLGRAEAAQQTLLRIELSLQRGDKPDLDAEVQLGLAEAALALGQVEPARAYVARAGSDCDAAKRAGPCRLEVEFERLRLHWRDGDRAQAVADAQGLLGQIDATAWGDGRLRRRLEAWLGERAVPS